MPVLRSQTVYLSITVFLSLALLQQHTLLLSHVPCFVSASHCSCSLMCLALSQHHAALALSCALLCLSITLLLLSHVPCFVSASRCTAYHAALILMCLALSQYCFLNLSALLCLSILDAVLALSHVPNLPCYRSCSLLCLNITPLLRCLRVSRCSCSLYCFVRLSITMLSQVLHLSIMPLMCLALFQHDITPLFSALPFPLDIFPGYSIDCSTLLQSCPMN